MNTEAKWSDFSSLDGERMLAAANQLLPRWVALVLVVGIAWQLANIIWMLMPASTMDEAIVAPSTQAAAAGRRSADAVNVQVIADAHLFGEANPEDAPEATVVAAPVDHENLAETRLNLSLKGTIAYRDQESSIAIIADASNDEKIYTIRDSIVSGTTLHAVYADRVVLNTSGTLEVLKLPKEFPKGSSPRRNRTSASAGRTATSARAGSIRSVVAQNASKLSEVIRPTPYFTNGTMQGYRVYPGRDRKQFAALGLRPGDLIKDIDGAALTDPQQATQIFQNLGNSDQVSVTVERNGQPEVLVLKTSQLNLDDSQ